MRILAVIAVCLLSACAQGPTLAELEREALRTGDWSAVEQREALIERRDERIGPECSQGYLSTCIEHGLSVECACVRVRPGRMQGAAN